MDEFEERARKAAEAVKNSLGTDPADDRRLKRAQRPPAGQRVVAGAAVIAFLAAGVIGINSAGTDKNGTATTNPTFALASALKPFDQCTDALDYFKKNAPDHLGSERYYANSTDSMKATTAQGGAQSMAAQAQAPSSAPVTTIPGESTDATHSDTNVAEKGVDEPDLVKNDGKHIVIASGGHIRIYEATDGAPLLKSVIVNTDQNVLLAGNRILVYGAAWSVHLPSALPGQAQSMMAFPARAYSPTTTVNLYDISDDTAPKLVQSLVVDGSVLDARLVGSEVRLATSFSPDLKIPSPTYDNTGQIDQQSKDRLDDAISKTTIEDWTPKYTVNDGAGKQLDAGSLVDCNKLAHPSEFSGLDTTGVVAFDLNGSMERPSAVGVVAGGHTVYATAKDFYVTTTKWSSTEATTQTDIHEFDTSNRNDMQYVGSGAVPGTLLNEYAMSEYNGVLRVATTASNSIGWVNRSNIVQGVVTTLGEKDGKLVELGHVDGLGAADNESIRSVRFIGDKGYVVTFRQTDPLFVIDLHDPNKPKVAGRLDIPGYSGYLHPVGKSLILGVGKGVASGITCGHCGPSLPPIQFSLFDVSDPANPKRLATQNYQSGTASAEYDPKAFLFWEPKGLVFAPVQTYGGSSFNGTLALKVDTGSLTQVGKIDSPSTPVQTSQRSKYATSSGPGTLRTFVIANNVYSLDATGIRVSSLDSLASSATVSF